MCPCVGTRTPQCVCGGQKTIWGVCSLLPSRGLRGLDSDCQPCWQAPLPTEPARPPRTIWISSSAFLGWAKCNIYLCANEAHFIRNWMDMGAICSAFTKSSNFSSHRGICPLEHKWHFSMNQISEYQSTECKVSLWGFSTLELICYNYTSARRG